ncbi:hypothetical protein E6O75_ATG04805 [Venturia nashicola]|uniref:Uncharacterized protein n=1 Tax=Venturia nashicola TaxID=86259 RepID=A0A4Z1P100_9PEZI|nr:hypothetical protein E6O75_ATG04805 [Venturia nashicola]
MHKIILKPPNNPLQLLHLHLTLPQQILENNNLHTRSTSSTLNFLLFLSNIKLALDNFVLTMNNLQLANFNGRLSVRKSQILITADYVPRFLQGGYKDCGVRRSEDLLLRQALRRSVSPNIDIVPGWSQNLVSENRFFGLRESDTERLHLFYSMGSVRFEVVVQISGFSKLFAKHGVFGLQLLDRIFEVVQVLLGFNLQNFNLVASFLEAKFEAGNLTSRRLSNIMFLSP